MKMSEVCVDGLEKKTNNVSLMIKEQSSESWYSPIILIFVFFLLAVVKTMSSLGQSFVNSNNTNTVMLFR